MNRVSKNKSIEQVKEIYSEFYKHFSDIFFESELQLFHAYALQKVQALTKGQKKITLEEKRKINDLYILASLSIPLTNKLTNFERLSFIFESSTNKEFDESNLISREELHEAARMLNVEGQPSRTSVIHFINIENLLTNTNEHIAQLFHLVESETSPFIIARKGREALSQL
jgi:histone acetyltransferase (RNA polymerase elongator complex component)